MPNPHNDAQPKKPKQLRLDAVPKDVYKILITEQGKKKVDCECQFSLEQTIYMLIRRAVKEEK